MATVSAQPAAGARRSAGRAEALMSRTWMLMAGFGLASVGFVLARLIERWHVGPAASHQVTLLGQRFSYPAANLGAIVVLVLALLGLAVTALTAAGTLKELTASRRFARRLARAPVRTFGHVRVLEHEQMLAFCAGLLRPRVYISTGTLDRLDGQAVEAILAHERQHARRRDPLRLAVGRVLARVLLFVPGFAELWRRQQELAELSVDERVIAAAPEHRPVLARAMLAFTADGQGSGIDPARVDHLISGLPGWRFPGLLCLGAGLVLGVMSAVAVLAGQVAAGSATLALPFLSSRPCIVVLALVPAGVVALALGLRGRADRVGARGRGWTRSRPACADAPTEPAV